jgi:hypothetical protein
MLKKIVVLVCVFVFSFAQITFSQMVEPSYEVTLPSGEVVKMTKSQFETLISKPGVGYTNVPTFPFLPEGSLAVPIPPELGGGYVIGTPEAIASGMNAANITVGATAGFVSGAGISTSTILIGIAVAGGLAALALGAGGGGGAAAH